jgi:hypothetical protein
MQTSVQGDALVILLLFAGMCFAQETTTAKQPKFDLSTIGFTVNGHQICEDKGRLQDYPSQMMDHIISSGPTAVPVLIGMITDTRTVKTEVPIICYFRDMTIGDLAFSVLTDLFTDANDRNTIPGVDWASMMDSEDKDRSSADQLHLFVKRHGRAVLQAKWRKLWTQYKNQVCWDAKERCFRLKGK